MTHSKPHQSPSEDGPELIQYANTPEGVLAQRDPERMRRFLLEASSPSELAARQMSLWSGATSDLALWPAAIAARLNGNRDRTSSPVVRATVYIWPVLLTTSQTVRVRNYFHWEGDQALGLRHKLESAWAQSLDIDASRVRMLEVFSARHLLSVSPMQVHSWLNGRCRDLEAGAQSLFPRKTVMRPSGWPMSFGADVPVHSEAGTDLPMVYLLSALVSTETESAIPKALPGHNAALQQLLDAVFTHVLAAENIDPTFIKRKVVPQVRLGQIESFCDALTQAQVMEFGWLCERAGLTNQSVQFRHEYWNTLDRFIATATDEEGDVRSSIDYCYDGFWRPANHIETILQGAALAQGTRRMDCDRYASLALQ